MDTNKPVYRRTLRKAALDLGCINWMPEPNGVTPTYTQAGARSGTCIGTGACVAVT